MERSEDWAWFGGHPERTHRARLATSAEIAHLQKEQGLDASHMAPGCFVYAISRLKRDDPPLELQTLFVVLKPRGEMDEAECRQAWHEAEGMVGAWKGKCNERRG